MLARASRRRNFDTRNSILSSRFCSSKLRRSSAAESRSPSSLKTKTICLKSLQTYEHACKNIGRVQRSNAHQARPPQMPEPLKIRPSVRLPKNISCWITLRYAFFLHISLMVGIFPQSKNVQKAMVGQQMHERVQTFLIGMLRSCMIPFPVH